MADTVDLDWNNIANEAATAFGTALGGQLGAAVGKAIGSMLFGAASSTDPFQTEVRDSLAVINSKLDQVLSWINQFPELLEKGLTAARIEELRIILKVQTGEVFSEIKIFEDYAVPTVEQARKLADASQELISVSQTLMGTQGTNPEVYVTAMSCFVVGAGAFLRAGRTDPSLLEGLYDRARTTSLENLSPQLSPRTDGKNFREALNRINTAGPIAQQFTSYIYNASKEFLLSWQPNKLIGPDVYEEHGCWLGILPDGRLMGDTLFNRSTIPGFNPATDLGKFRFKVAPYWTPIEGPSSWGPYNELVRRTYGAMAEVERFKAYQPHLSQAVAALESFKNFLDALASLSANRVPSVQVSVEAEAHLPLAIKRLK